MRHGSLFSGIGGFDLAAAWMNWENVFHCEKNGFCSDILKFYWPEGESHGDIKKFNATKHRGTIDVLSAGFPCQPFSIAGERTGQADNRYLWPQALRIIAEIKPRWLVLENVVGLLGILEPECLTEVEIETLKLFYRDQSQGSNGIIRRIRRRIIGTILSEIQSAGYLLPVLTDGTPVVLCIPACAVNAPHRRDRIWIVAYSHSERLERGPKTGNSQKERSTANEHFVGLFNSDKWTGWTPESTLCSGNDGVPVRLDGVTFSTFRNESLKAYGNSVVPQVAFQIFQAIEKSDNNRL